MQQVEIQDEDFNEERMKGQVKLLENDDNVIKRFKGRTWIPRYDIRKLILEEVHRVKYSIHSRSTNMYRDLKLMY